MHKCTKSDWAKFYKPATKYKSRFNDLKKRHVMYCPNDKDTKGIVVDKNLYGPDDSGEHLHIELDLQPCKPIQLTRRNRHLRGRKCIVDLKNKRTAKSWYQNKLKAVKKYLGEPAFVMAFNTEHKHLARYDDDSVLKSAHVI